MFSAEESYQNYQNGAVSISNHLTDCGGGGGGEMGGDDSESVDEGVHYKKEKHNTTEPILYFSMILFGYNHHLYYTVSSRGQSCTTVYYI
jgi:hypothetical protein